MSVEISLTDAQYEMLKEVLTQVTNNLPTTIKDEEEVIQPIFICHLFDDEDYPYKLYLHPDNDAKEMTWDEAMIYASQCRYDGYYNWQLPNRQELLRLYELQESGDLPDGVEFIAGVYWSSSAASASTAWRQGFNSGPQGQNSKTFSSYVRLVRRHYSG